MPGRHKSGKDDQARSEERADGARCSCRAEDGKREVPGEHRLETLGFCASGVVHDFNNLLTAIMVYSDLIRDSVEPGSVVHRYNEEVRDVARRGARLAAQLMGMLRHEGAERGIVCCSSLLRGMREVLQTIIGQKIELRIEVECESCFVAIPATHLEQVVFNLALNARDAMPDGGKLTIRSGPCEFAAQGEKKPSVRISVSDTGIGMTKELMGRIFDPFVTSKPEWKGSGVGLAIVNKIVRDAGGTIEVESEIGIGTTISVILPRTAPESTQKREAEGASSLPGGKETIVLVQDDVSVRSAVAECLRRCGYTVMQTEKADEALSMITSGGSEIDLVITDLIVRGMSGRELARRIAGAKPNTRVLFISSYDVPAEGDEFIIGQPFDSRALATRVRQALGQAAVLWGQ